MSQASERVRQQYVKFPFPPLALGALAEVKPVQAEAAFAYWLIYRQSPPSSLRILDAGCGTGFSTLKLAEANPYAEIVALDWSSSSLEIAKQRLALLPGASQRIQWQEADLQCLPDVGLFDYIHSSGVIHHVPDPQAALNALHRHLKPTGVAYLMVYSGYARAEISQIQALVRGLWQDPQNWQEGLMICKALIQGLPQQHPLRQFHERSHQQVCRLLGEAVANSDAFWVDTYLQACEWHWTQPQWFKQLADTGWHFQTWLDPETWDLSSYLPALPDYAQLLTQPSAWALADILRPPHHFASFVTPQPAHTPVVIVDLAQRPSRFYGVQEVERGISNGRGQEVQFSNWAKFTWQMIDGHLSWQDIQHMSDVSEKDFLKWAQLCLDHGLVAQY